MIIQSLTMENFRQYYGEQTIEFAHSQNNEIVTVILGENGRGKTGIYRAIMFALFGDVLLEQDSKDSTIFLANIKAVQEAKEGEGINCAVTLKFTHNGNEYLVQRTFYAIKDANGNQNEQLSKVELINLSTQERFLTEQDIKTLMQTIIDERVKQYFFFDGERIERLTRTSPEQKQEVTVGIKNLLKIDQLIKSKDVINHLLNKVKKELEQHSTGEYRKALKEMSELESERASIQEKNHSLEAYKATKQKEIKKIDDSLQQYDKLKIEFEERERLEASMQQYERNIDEKFQQLKTSNKYIPLLYGESMFHQLLVRLDNELLDGFKGKINSSFVQSLLHDFRCICGTEFSNESSEYKQLKDLEESIRRYEETKDLHNLQNELKTLVVYLEGRKDNLQHVVLELDKLHAEYDNLLWKHEELNKRLSSSNENDVQKLNQDREIAIHDINETEYKLRDNLRNQERNTESIKQLEVELSVLEKKSGLHQQLLVKHNLLSQALKAATGVIKAFESELIDGLEMATLQNLTYLLDKSGRDIIDKVQINKDYTLEVLNGFGQPFLANISQGQRQVLSLSFITALAQQAGGNDRGLEMPLFMDTPFGRLSAQHQQNLINYLPEICSQWVLLVTDKEFGEMEYEQFNKSQAIGRFYKLISEEPGVTKIVENNSYVRV